MKAFIVLLTLLSIPIALMNFFGGIISVIWLASLGEWRIMGIGLLIGLFGTFFISVALMPTLLFALPSAKLIERGNIPIGVTLAIPSTLYTAAVMAGWCYLVFKFAFGLAAERHSIPILLWSYGVATGPWTYMAFKEDRGSASGASTMYAFFISIACLLMVLLRLIGGAEFSTCFTALIVVMVVAVVFHFALTIFAFSTSGKTLR